MSNTQKIKYNEVTNVILNLCEKDDFQFNIGSKHIQELMSNCGKNDILEHLNNAGIIPEEFGHDSTQEKLFAKYCDILLERAFHELGLEAKVIEERSGAADVEASYDDYEIVADAKAFRLSRTAKNQKDFKVEALDQWRNDADFACLVCPMYQYPNRKSQIYKQAITYNVVLLSYTHLALMIKETIKTSRLRELWELPGTLENSDSANDYWHEITGKVLELSGLSDSDWQKEDEHTKERLKINAEKQIKYLNKEKENIENLSHDEAIKMLLDTSKIDSKIETIKKTAGI